MIKLCNSSLVKVSSSSACKGIVFVIFIICVHLNGLSQGLIDGFLDSPKTKTLAVSYSTQYAETYYLADNELELDLNQSSISVFYKHQLTSKIGFVGSLPLINFKPQDGSVAAYYGNTRELFPNFTITGKASVGISHPLSDYNTESSTSIGQQAKSLNLRLNGQFTYKNMLFLNTRYGYNIVGSPTPDLAVASAKLGFYKGKWYADVWHEEIIAQGGKDYRGTGDLAPNNFRELGVSYKKIGGVVFHQSTEKTGFFVNWSHVYEGRNVYNISAFSAGAVWKF